jgi:hypothetical protein
MTSLAQYPQMIFYQNSLTTVQSAKILKLISEIGSHAVSAQERSSINTWIAFQEN